MSRFHKIGIFLALLVIIGCAYLGIKIVFMGDRDTEVPSVAGMHLTDAVDMLQTKGLLAHVDKVDSSLPVDTIVSQNLPAGEKVGKGKVIILRASKGGSVFQVPDVRGINFEEGVRMLANAGFKVDKISRVYDGEKRSGTIIAQNPSAPQNVSSSCMVNLLVSSGTSGKASFIEVPDFRGMKRNDAQSLVEKLGLKFGAASEQPSKAAPAGTIIATHPKKGARIPLGSTVNFTLAREPQPEELAAQTVPIKESDKERAAEVRKIIVKDTVPTVIPTKLPQIKPSENKPEPKPVEVKEPEVKKAEEPVSKQEPEPQTERTHIASKTAKVRYQVPPLAKPLSLKIEMTDENGTRILKDGAAKSGEYISMNVPYAGEARITIYLGGDFVWQDRYN